MRWYDRMSPAMQATVARVATDMASRQGGNCWLTVPPPAKFEHIGQGQAQAWVALAYLTLREELGLAELPPKE